MNRHSNGAIKELAPFETPVAPGIVRRTDRGLCVAGTRISLYTIMDSLKAGRTPAYICQWMLLTESQVNDAVRYIEENRESFEAEYAEVVRYSEELEKYYRERSRQMKTNGIPKNLTPKQMEAWERLQAIRRERERSDDYCNT